MYTLEKQFDVNEQKKKEMVIPIRLTESVKENHINLLLLYKNSKFVNDECVDDLEEYSKSDMKRVFDESDGINKHYCWIKNMSALVCSQITKRQHKIFLCDRCLNHFHSKEVLQKHIEICKQINVGRVNLPNEQNCWAEFKNYRYKLEIPFIIYADIESLLIPINDDDLTNDISAFDDGVKRPDKVPSGAYQKHIPNSIGFYFHSRSSQRQSYYKSYSGPQCIDQFMCELYEIARDIYPIMNQKRPLRMNDNDDISFQNATACHICGKAFVNTVDEKKVRDHCHSSGAFRGAAHNKCNLQYQQSKVLPIVFHNLDYDSHFLIEKLATSFSGPVTIIPKTSEKYISFTKTIYQNDLIDSECNAKRSKFDPRLNLKLRFIDSFRFLQSALAKLASYLPIDKKRITRREWKSLNDADFELLSRKGEYPYSYMDDWEKLKETKLPSIEAFYDTLTKKSIRDEDYEFAKTVWQTFNIQNMLEYTELYLKTDVLLLADIFENFRDNCLNLYGLDPAHYHTLPGYSWDCMLKITGVKIQLFTDIDMVTFIERGLRGGISQCSKRYCKANNKYLDDYEPNQPSNYLMYFDVNNLYGWAMTQSLPISNFEWIEEFQSKSVEEVISMVNDTPNNSEVGYMLEVDLQYPTYLHNLHNDYPFCCEHMRIGDTDEKKLILSLTDKRNYVLHYETLKLALANGLKLTAVHRCLKFKQSNWLECYIMLNTHERAKSKNEFEKNLYKLMNNAVFGKSMQNVRNQVDIKLVNTWDGRAGAKALIARPTFKSCKIFSENLVAIEMLRTNITMDKPIIIGASILEISKLKMYNFHYNFMLRNYSVENCHIAYTDTDSFVYDINCDDVYVNLIKKNYDQFDTSDFLQPNQFGIEAYNKKVVGVMKDENNGKIMREFVGLRSKMYSLRMNDDQITKKAKGVKKYVLTCEIDFDDYINCLFNDSTYTGQQSTFRSHLHEMYSINTTKIMLDGKDDKRYILKDKIHTMALGHFEIE